MIKRLPFYGQKTLNIVYEFAMVLSETAKAQGVEMTPEISNRGHKILMEELKNNGLKKTALNFVPLILAALEA